MYWRRNIIHKKSEIFFETIQPLRFNDNKDCKASQNQQALKEYSLSLALAQLAHTKKMRKLFGID